MTNSMPQKKILHISLCGVSNIGDEAITDCLARIMKNMRLKYSHFPLNYSPRVEGVIGGGGSRLLVFKEMVKKILRNIVVIKFLYQSFMPLGKLQYYKNACLSIKDADVVGIGGGNILMDLDYIFPLHVWLLVKIARFHKKKVGFICVGVGPVNTMWGRFFISRALRESDFIITRDSYSTSLANKFAGFGKASQSFDPVFCIDELYPIDFPLDKIKSNRILVSVFPYGSSVVGYSSENSSFEEQYLDLVSNYITKIKTSTGREVALLVTDLVRDTDVAEKISSRCGKLDVITPKTVDRLLYEIRCCSYLLATRMHPAIIASSVGTNFNIMAWQDKIYGCIGDAGYSDNVISLKDLIGSDSGVDILVEATHTWLEKISYRSGVNISVSALLEHLVFE